MLRLPDVYLHVMILLTIAASVTYSFSMVPPDTDLCDINACDALRKVREELARNEAYKNGAPLLIEETSEMKINKLERRLRSVEQPGGCLSSMTHIRPCFTSIPHK